MCLGRLCDDALHRPETREVLVAGFLRKDVTGPMSLVPPPLPRRRAGRFETVPITTKKRAVFDIVPD
jgi:hypothetical protein